MPFTNKKTGNRYAAIAWYAQDCTNERDGTDVVVYIRYCWWWRIIRALLAPRFVFVREKKEFLQKFEVEE